MTAVETHRQHGTHVKFVVDKCRCDECRLANNAYERERRSRLTPPYVSALPAREHIEELARQGVGLKTIAKVSGVSHGALSKLVYGDRTRGRGPSKRIRPETSSKILAVMPSDVADGAKVDAGPSWAILDALIAAGVPKSQLAERLGQAGPGLQLSRGLIAARNARTVAELGREWRAGTLSYERRWRGQVLEVVTLDPPPIESPAVDQERRLAAHRQAAYRARKRGAPEPELVHDDGDTLVLEVAAALERRIDEADWRQSAACRGRETWVWFPAASDTVTIAAAKRICSACFVSEQCLEANLDQDEGIYGGLTERERAQELRRRRRTGVAA